MKKILVMAALFCACSMSAATMNVANGDDDVVSALRFKSLVGQTPGILNLDPATAPWVGQDAVLISSLCASASTNLAQSQRNTMAGLAGVGTVPTDRINNPAAWYRIPQAQPQGLQWFDAVTTSTNFHSYMGSSSLTNVATGGEWGNRIVVHAAGTSPVSAYWCRITTTITNIPAAFFPVGTNTAGVEIAFNSNFVGVNFGTNGVCESAYDPAQGKWVAGGDDAVYDAGQSPSVVQYHWWVRFGATAVITISNPSEYSSIRSQFALMDQTFKAELIRTGVVDPVASQTVFAAKSRLWIVDNTDPLIRIGVDGGQVHALYDLLSATNLVNAPWELLQGQTFYTGRTFDVTNSTPEKYFRLRMRVQ
ncbi:MAG: hypothetical protein AAB365_04100 [Patescibacteria group bacterium]